jgi:hypothetical protein
MLFTISGAYKFRCRLMLTVQVSIGQLAISTYQFTISDVDNFGCRLMLTVGNLDVDQRRRHEKLRMHIMYTYACTLHICTHAHIRMHCGAND